MMNRAASVRLFGVCALAALFPGTASGQGDSVSWWVAAVAPGVLHEQRFISSGPWHLNVLRIDLRRRDITLRGLKGNDAFASREKLTSMAARYKGPGKVVAAINTDFFDVKTGESENNVVIEGLISKGVILSDSPHDRFNARHSQLGIDWKNRAFIERFGLNAKLIQGGKSVLLDGLNYRPPYPNSIVLYTPFAGDSSPPDTVHRNSVYLPVKLVRRSMNDIVFRIAGPAQEGRRVSTSAGGVLIADGSRRDELKAMAQRGGTVRITARLAPDHGDLRTVVGGWPMIVNDGKSVAEYSDFVEGTFTRFAVGRNPRSAAGISKDGSTLYLVTVDGRRTTDAGMSLVELAKVMMQLGAYDAMNFDGGGSTTMVVDGKIVNRPSDQAGERPIGSGLLIIVEGDRKGLE
jgi:exopolysaccharide biosynthesis protein